MGCTPSKDVALSSRNRRRTWNALLSRRRLSVRVAKSLGSATDADYVAAILSANCHETIKKTASSSSTQGIKAITKPAQAESNSMSDATKQILDADHENAMDDVYGDTADKPISAREVEETNTQIETINTWELMEGLDDDKDEDEDEDEDEETISLDPRNDPLHRALSFKYIFSHGSCEDPLSLGRNTFPPSFSALSSPEFSAVASLKDWLPSDSHSSKHAGEPMGTLQSSIRKNFQHVHANLGRSELKYVDSGPTQLVGNPHMRDDLFDNPETMKDGSKLPIFDPDLLESFEEAMLELSKEEWNAARSTKELLVSSFKRNCSNSRHQLKMIDAADTIYENDANHVDIISKTSGHRGADQIESCDDQNQRKIFWGNRLSFNGCQNSWHLNVHTRRCDAKCVNVVFYSTTSQLDTKTFKACNQVRGILVSLIGATFDEKSISNYPLHREELMYALNIPTAVVPTVYAKGRYVVGIDSIVQLHKKGLLGPMLRKAMHLES